MNTLSYAYHYRDLDSTRMLAHQALSLADDYGSGYAEACNNLAFAEMAKLNFSQARAWLEKVEQNSNNQIELLIADVQYMRICQREAHNKDFYSYRQKAIIVCAVSARKLPTCLLVRAVVLLTPIRSLTSSMPPISIMWDWKSR